MKSIWIVDDDQSIRFVLEKALLRENLPTRSFTSPREVLQALDSVTQEEFPQILVSDIRMPGGSGLDLLTKVKERLPALPVIIMTAFSDLDSAVSAFQGGAFEYLPKPFDLPKAVELIRRALDESQREQAQTQAQDATPEMLGQAPAMQDVFRAIGRLSQSNVTVMITGESGSGKELVARALHKHSPRGDAGSKGPFVAINTAAIPKDLLESELFGHERGAFTGAQTTRRGRFEQAEGGTLFLDEIGDMPFDLQTRLLRVLSDGTYYRVGGHNAIKANVRVIAATHQDLEKRVKDGVFREDLFHRLNVIRLRLPALRERREDIPTLTRHFLQQSAQQLGVEPKRIADSAQTVLNQFAFPGNVRQLENICHWLTVMAPAQVIEPKDLPPEVTLPADALAAIGHVGQDTLGVLLAHGSDSVGAVAQTHQDAMPMAQNIGATPVVLNMPGADWEQGLEAEAMSLLVAGRTDVWDVLVNRVEAKLIQTALANTRGRRIEAAQKLGIGRNTITRKIQELGLDD
ncbi:nitrogen regulation protein NR(I) [Limnohabitans sp. MORI2]|uniref:nitrogen regulation protein NR(I) n=1 Tax=Limnohabitans sp. MORI2 TaxID=1751150 RepID=UPI0023772B9D|nr:nitrogen regulation protein NR(I) [Limnohabitans sp. MORI2]BDU57881.1 nitrogen regulation protein NR(I) [Limnohabitans sp. MORI2]